MVEVFGNVDNLQSCIDFYLNITSKDAVLDSRYMRDRFFAEFDREDSLREENFLVFPEISSDYEIDYSVEPVLSGEECVFDGNTSYFSPKVEEVVSFGTWEVSKEVIEIEDRPNEDFSSGLQGDEEEFNDDDVFSFWGSSEEADECEEASEVNVEEDKSENDWADYSEEDDSDTGFVWGDYSEDESNDLESDVEEVEVQEEAFVWGDYSEVSDIEDNTDEKDSEEVEEEFLWGESEDKDFWGSFEEPKNIVVNVPKVEVEKQVIDVPKDIREFVKMYPNCELEFVYKYFSKKEVQRALELNKVFKRKGKLFI